ncbi:MAG: glycosyltransferase family 4 protein [Pirellulales bacterium]|nr:glycosyltransferase family 4 protein [Pirellulales bacterium]
MMRIGVDARCLNVAHLRGMGKYVQEVISRIDQNADVHWCFFSDRPEWPFHIPEVRESHSEIFEMKGYRFRSWEQIGLPWRACRRRIQVMLCPSTTLPWWQPFPTVVTLHDTIPWSIDEGVQYRGAYLGQIIPRALRRCSAIITGSESAKKDIGRLWPELGEKIRVITHGIHDRYFADDGNSSQSIPASLRVQLPYFLYIGGSDPRKRFDWACRILRQLDEHTVRLVVCGMGQEDRLSVEASIAPNLRPRVIFAPFIPEEDMPSLLRNAVAVLYPTLYEGFGFPVVESQAVGTPVLFSKLGSLSELVGPAAEVLPPKDLDAWVQTCRRLLAERGETRQPNEEARCWARQFSWETSAAKHLEVLQAAAKSRSGKS